MYGQHWL